MAVLLVEQKAVRLGAEQVALANLVGWTVVRMVPPQVVLMEVQQVVLMVPPQVVQSVLPQVVLKEVQMEVQMAVLQVENLVGWTVVQLVQVLVVQ